MDMKNIFTFLLISGLFSSCLENNPQQKTEITELTNTDTNATEKITKEEKKAWLKSSQVSLYKEDTIIWSDEKAIIFNKEGYKVLFEDEDRTYYEAEGIYEFSIEEIKNYKSSEPERYEKMMNELSRRSNNYTLLFIKGPFIVYKDEYYFDVGAHPVGGEELICYSLLTDSIIKTLDITYESTDQFEIEYKKALATIENIITEEIFDTSAINLIQKQNCGESELYVFLRKTDSNGIDIRNKPDGEIINKLIHDEDHMGYIITLIEAINGWFKISEIDGIDFDVPKLKNEAWIHSSFVAVSTRNYGNQELELLDNPNSRKVIAKIRNIELALEINDLCGDWVQVNYQNQLGWINKEWLCGNPVTTCP